MVDCWRAVEAAWFGLLLLSERDLEGVLLLLAHGRAGYVNRGGSPGGEC